MGRKALPADKVRSKQIIAKVTASEHKRVYVLAKRMKMTGSEFLRFKVGLK